ncbi:MAG TPA: bifunctional YncE family protein/alkaline phosphatase family protein [Pyrinomonadaceae bacterium]|nr:bifunctional YncE family protein/alkaline phosphatase family protein [Chloracidobacterium sp.]MBP9934295.1 bifunctional YncE family protein/alkaline phosphatase family protein [Pyrinomonadaceae bacterium]MBK7801508.1 bifunctional YncE family protein/alkaline phosphatase family protein [Chloracidobacterium sp.]MBK9436826.1 bifunctional YncE family protein/alkaline phosphatase family protein [Chloracidobacterium sp.]MBL0241818.1 bifunctional YncE family protein/alkaline phosphatase family prot
MRSRPVRRLTILFVALATAASITAYFIQTRSTWAGTDPVWPTSSDSFRPSTPAGKLILDSSTGLPAVAPMTMNFVRTPDTGGPDGKGRFLIAVNSGYGIVTSSKTKPQQTLSVIDLAAAEPSVVQTIYFPAPQSANFGLVFDPVLQPDGRYRFYVAGGYENKIWIMGLDPRAAKPVTPANKSDERVSAPFIDVTAFAENAPSPNYNDNIAAVYPTGIALAPDGETLYSANNLGDSLGVISDLRDTRKIERVGLRRSGSKQFIYPYDVKALSFGKRVTKVYVSLWGDGSIAVIKPGLKNRVTHIAVGRHPTAMIFNKAQSRLIVVNSDSDSVSVIDTRSDRVVETINVRLAEKAQNGASPEGLALSGDEERLFVANAHINAVAVVEFESTPTPRKPSKLLGFVPTGSYASAVAVVGNRIFVANGKGTGMDNSSQTINDSGRYPNMPNEQFPAQSYNKRGMYSAAIVSGNISLVTIPDERRLFAYSQAVMRNEGLLGREKRSIFPDGRSPFKHVIYVMRENRTYDQVFGDLMSSGDGTRADGDPSVAIFGAGESARSPSGEAQNITPNARSLVMRFGLFDRFFVNAEASPDGHNWSTAAFSNDYVDKAFRWDYSGRGRTYDYEGFNRLPSFNPPGGQPPVALPPVFDIPATASDVANFLKRYVPYLNGARDIAEPESLYLWDAANRAGLSYRNYGEFVGTISAEDVRELNTRKPKRYPDLSPNVTAFATKKSLEGHFSTTVRNFDQSSPDSFTTESYRSARTSANTVDPAITDDNSTEAFRGTSRYGAWAAEFRSFVADLQAGKGDHLPNLSIIKLSNDHTSGLRRGTPTPQFYVAENDYALGRLVEDVSKSPYWADTAIFVVEDDAQDGPDHVDAHRSPGLVISAYNRPGALVHEFHNTVSLIRTMELCLGISPMNFIDANATPIDIFTSKADLRPYVAELPIIALDNLYPPTRPNGAMAYYMDLTDRQDLKHEDMADPRQLNEIIWFSVKGDVEMPVAVRMPAFDLMTAGVKPDDDEKNEADDD